LLSSPNAVSIYEVNGENMSPVFSTLRDEINAYRVFRVLVGSYHGCLVGNDKNYYVIVAYSTALFVHFVPERLKSTTKTTSL
jgi:hypothetical protein